MADTQPYPGDMEHLLDENMGRAGDTFASPKVFENRNGGQNKQTFHNFLLGAHQSFTILEEASNTAAETLRGKRCQGITCHRKINNVRYLNKFFESINRSLETDGYFVGCVEVNHQLRMRLKEKYPAIVRHPWFFVHFLVRRVLPKWGITKKLFFFITRGKNRVLSLTEVLGRLVSCGFEIRFVQHTNGITWFAVQKKRDPDYNMNPTYGPLVGLDRIGKNGKMLRIYKLRTMHPYAEYLQDYIYRLHSFQNGGKFHDDIRITGWGRFLRKYWLDEQPMWWNFIKRELKLVGVRPLSRHYFSLYPQEMQTLRIRHKPGLIPPFYYDLPETFEEIVASERRYLLEWQKQPLRTDLRYLFRALYHIFFKGARSR